MFCDMSDPVELWRQIHESFEWHRIKGFDSDAQAAMDRVAMKCLGYSFNDTNCTVREELLKWASLHELKLRPGQTTEPRRLGGAIVVLVYEGKRFVIDGSRRVNKWIKQKSKGPFRAIVVEPHTTSSPAIKEGG